MKYRHVAWDFDGTLYDSYAHIIQSIRRTIEDLGVTDTEENIARLAHVTVGHAMNYYAPLCRCPVEDLFSRYSRFMEEVSPLCVPYEGIPQLLKDIVAAGGRNHICTNRDLPKTFGYLQRDGIDGCFDVFSCKTPEIAAKPAPDLVLHVLNTGKIAPEELLMVGDRNLDIEAARNANVHGCFFDPDGFSVPTSNPLFVAKDVNELRKILLD